MVGAVGDPALHPQEIEQLRFVVQHVDQVDRVLREVRHGVHHQEREADHAARSGSIRLDERVDVVVRQRARPPVHVAGAGLRVVLVAVEIDRRDGEREARTFSGKSAA